MTRAVPSRRMLWLGRVLAWELLLFAIAGLIHYAFLGVAWVVGAVR